MKVLQFIELFVCFQLFNIIVGSSIRIAKHNENELVEISMTMLNVLKSCYNNNHRTVVINGQANNIVIKLIQRLETSIILHNSSTNKELNHKNKVDLFVITTKEPANLEKILLSFKESPWWNIMTTFFILSESDDKCRSAKISLKILWDMDILTSYFLCIDLQQRVVFYTFNPYSNYAPSQWIIYKEVAEKKYMAIYSRVYDQGKICEGFNFDRTKHLDRATINIACCVPENKAPSLINSTFKKEDCKFSDYELHLISNLRIAFNTSITFEYGSTIVDVNSKRHNAYNLLGNKTSDFLLCHKSHNHLFGFSASYTVIYTGFSIFSHNQGFRTPLEKIYKFYGPVMIAATIIISTMTYCVIWYVSKPQRHSFAVFEIIRLWTNTSLYTKIDTLALRTFFGVIFIYFLILQATFQGHLSKFLTKFELRDNAEALVDLRSSYYESIHVTNVTKHFLKDDILLKSKSHITTIPNCIDSVLNSTSAACIMNYLGFLQHFKKKNLSREVLKNFYLPKVFLRNSYLIFVTRNDWPLKIKFDHIIMILENTGNLLMLNNNLTTSLESSLFYKKIESEFKSIDLNSLLFIFYFLILGLTSATVCFVIEKFIVRSNCKVKKQRIVQSVKHDLQSSETQR